MRNLVSVLLVLMSCALKAQTFTSTAGGNIPDGTAAVANSYGAPLDVPIVVSGVAQGTIDTVSIGFSANHSFVGDLEVTLISPYGQEHLLFARTGATDANGGSSANLVAANVYSFVDTSATNWWTAAVIGDVNIPSSSVRTVVTGGPGVTNPAPVTSIISVFQRRPPNGTWILRFRDGWSGDIGNVTSASITLSTTGVTRTVTKIEDTNDGTCDSDCSLREAIAASSDGVSSVDRIEFARPFFDSPRRIVLNSDLRFVDAPFPVFAWVGPGAPSLTISGSGLYAMQFGASGGLRSFAGTRIAEVTGFISPGISLLHGMEFAFVNGGITFFVCEMNDSSIHSSSGSDFAQLFLSSGSTLRRVTVSQNTVRNANRPSTIFANGIIRIIDSAIVQNQAFGIGTDAVGGISANSQVRLQNSVVAGNRAIGSTGTQQDLGSRPGGSFQSLGHNVIGDVGSFAASFSQPGDQTGTMAAPLNPVLSPLSRHGGLIPVHVPLPGSPLLDKGRRISRDARGVALVDLGGIPNATEGNGGDIGAVELSPLQVSTLNDGGPGSLRQILQDAPAAPVVTDILITPNLLPGAKITLTGGELLIGKNVSIHGPGARNLTVSGNRQSRVLAVQPGARVSISGLTLADGNGIGAISNNSGGIVLSAAGSQLTMVNTVLRNGRANLIYGGWLLSGFGEFTNGAIIGNRSDALGAVDRSMLLMHRTTVSNCSPRCFVVGGLADASVIDSTFAAADSELVSIFGRGFTRNTLFAGSLGVIAPAVLISGGHNLVGATDSTVFSGPGDQAGTPAVPIALRLSPLAYHGGPVPTQVPLAGNPALDKGRRSGADARGLRSFDIASIAAATNGDDSDIGAVEAQALFVNNTNDSGPGSLREAVFDANANGVALDDVLFDLPPASTINLSSRLPNPVAGGALNLLGPGADQLTITGSNVHQLFSFTAPGHLGLSRLTLREFRGVDGPALEAYQTEVHLTELQVLNNGASREGGAMLIGDADAVIESSTFAGNTATNNYGGIAYLGNNSRLLVRNSTFSGNSGPSSSAIANIARGTGSSVVELESTTLADNTGSAALTSVANSSGAAVSRAQNTLFGGATSSILNSGANASFVSLGFNLSSTTEPLLNQSTDRVNANPNLGPLQNNGGATFTRALQIPSAAIDAGIRSGENDQRVSPRTIDLLSIANAPGSDGTDIGAFELQSAPDNPPLSNFSPAGGTISYTTSGTALPIVVTPSGGSGSGQGATTTVGVCTITAGGAAFPTTVTAQLSFVGSTTTAQNLNLPNCVPQSTATNATLTCPVVRGTDLPLTRFWTLNCPALAADPIFNNGFEGP